MKETDILRILVTFVVKIVYHIAYVIYSMVYIYLFIIRMYLVNSYLLALNDFQPSD